MIEALGEIVRNVAIIVLLTSFMEMLLPNSSLQRFIKVIVGLFIMVTILNPILTFLKQDMVISSWQFNLPSKEEMDTVLAQGQEVIDFQQHQIIGEYQARLEQQMEAMVKLIPDINTVKCQISVEPVDKIGGIGKINTADFWITLRDDIHTDFLVEPVKPIIIDGKNSNASVSTVIEDKQLEIKEKITGVIANYFNVDKNFIKITIN